MNQSNMMKTAENIDSVAKFMSGLMKAVAIVCAVFAVLVLIFGNTMFESGFETLELDFLKVHLTPEYQAANSTMRVYVIVAMLACTLMFTVIVKGLNYLRRILQPMKAGRPFDENVPEYLKKIAWMILFAGAAIQVSGIVCRAFIVRAFPLDEIFAANAVAELEYVFRMDVTFVLVFCIVMLLSHIFEYGQQLQIESDETL